MNSIRQKLDQLTLLRRRLDSGLHPITFYRGRRYQRSRPAESNLFLITMNHGGTHWLRQLMANALIEAYELPEELENIKNFDVIPPYHRKHFRFKYEDDHNILRMQQGHTHYCNFHFKNQQVLLLIRDLRDAVVSHFRSYKSKKNPDAEFSSYLRGEGAMRHGNSLQKRIQFLNSWSTYSNRTLKFKLVKFESLRSDTSGTLNDILTWAKFPNVNETLVQNCVERASIDRMKKLESKMQDKSGTARPSKVREGSVGGYQKWFNEDDQAYFQSEVNEKLKDPMGYDYNTW